ncbi:tRNA pseudouridine(38-40) synthase TruA [Haloplasma contractile]|nr:tRNA pseudouridine(38-40) synthase TruA [Haloplasma contractile]
MIRRIKCIVEYDGSSFNGYQRQAQTHVRTVQYEIERLFQKLHQKDITIHSSGRTDTGVHALGQVFHFDTDLPIPLERWKDILNRKLPFDIYIRQMEEVSKDFHSRFHAVCKEYHYHISLNEYDPFKARYCNFINQPLDVNKMKHAIQYFIGTHDFTGFSSDQHPLKDKERTIHDAKIVEDNGNVTIIFRGTGFLRYQVRIMVGTLIEIGMNKRDDTTIETIFDTKNRSNAGYTAEPQGLYLMNVEYN